MDTRGGNALGVVLAYHHVLLYYYLAGVGIDYILGGEAAHDTVFEGFDLLLAAHYVGYFHTADILAAGGEAVVLTHNHVLRYVDQTAGQIARVRSTQCGICQRFTRAVCRKEEFQYAQAFAEVCLYRQLYDLTRRRSHQAAHTGQLTNLVHGASGTGRRHHVDGVVVVHYLAYAGSNIVGRVLPDVDDRLIALVLGQKTAAELTLDLLYLLLRLGQYFGLIRRHANVGNRHGDGEARRIIVAHGLDVIQHFAGSSNAVRAEAAVADLAQILLAYQFVYFQREHGIHVVGVALYKAHILRNDLVEYHAAQ